MSNVTSKALVFLMLPIAMSIGTSMAQAQNFNDLLGDQRGTEGRTGGSTRAPRVRVRHDRARTDLRLTGDVIPTLTGRERERGEIGVSAELDLNFICGKFDLEGTFENLLTKEVREDFVDGLLGYVESEVTGSAMELLCQAQPTLCTLLQNHNIAANLKLGYHHDRCSQIQSALDNAQRQVYAGAVEQCLREKQAAGVPLDRALDACRRANRVRGFGGEVIAEFDLGHEIRKVLSLSGDDNAVLAAITEDVRYGGTWSEAKPNPDAITSIHDGIRRKYVREILDLIDTRQTLKPSGWNEKLASLTPRGMPGMTKWEIYRLAELPDDRLHAAVASLASAFTLADLGLQIHEAERLLEAVMGLPTIEENQRKLLENRIYRLREERRRLKELYDDREYVQNAQLRVNSLLTEEYYSGIRRRISRERADGRRRGLSFSASAWGGRTPRPSPLKRASGKSPSPPPSRSHSHKQSGQVCPDGCAGNEVRIGDVGGGR